MNNKPLSSGSLTSETKSLGYFRKTEEIQVPEFIFFFFFFFSEVEQQLAPEVSHHCHIRPLFFLHIHFFKVGRQVQSSLRFIQCPSIYPSIHLTSIYPARSFKLFSSSLIFFQDRGPGNSGTLGIS